MEETLFTKIIARQIPAKIAYEDERYIAIHDVSPQAPVHVLVVPRRHVASLAEADDALEVGAIALLAAQVARAEGIDGSGYRTVMNSGADGGQTVHHLHMHLLGGRAMKWPPG